MQSGRNASCQQIQPLHPRSAQGLDRSGTKESQDHPSSRIRHIRRGWRNHQTEIEDAVTPIISSVVDCLLPSPPILVYLRFNTSRTLLASGGGDRSAPRVEPRDVMINK